jgi:hypothetical protein
MAKQKNWRFESFEELEERYLKSEFDCDDIADFTDSLVLDWCERLDDWAPKVALCFNRHTSSVTLDRISQSKLPELRRLVCYHRNVSMETMERLLNDGDRECREAAGLYLEKRAQTARTR